MRINMRREERGEMNGAIEKARLASVMAIGC